MTNFIPKESIKKIWDRFYKSDLSRGKDKKGTGLGLAIVKEIIQAHNQTINVVSTVDVGTEFVFTLKYHSKKQEASSNYIFEFGLLFFYLYMFLLHSSKKLYYTLMRI